MRTCRHCGKENSDDAALCPECGLELGDSALHRAVAKAWARSMRFFRWRPASILLILLAVLYAASVLLNLWLASVHLKRGEQQMSHIMCWGAFWNALVAALCVVGRHLMAFQTRLRLLAGALAVTVALLVVMRASVNGFLGGKNPFLLVEALLIWLPLIYAIIYACRESNRNPAAS